MPVNEREMTERTDEFARALAEHAPAYQVQLNADMIARLTGYR